MAEKKVDYKCGKSKKARPLSKDRAVKPKPGK